jgi:hypothetical protein
MTRAALIHDPERHAGEARDLLLCVEVELEVVALEELLITGGVRDAQFHRVRSLPSA